MWKEERELTIYEKAVQAMQIVVKRSKPKSSSAIKSCVVALYTSAPVAKSAEYQLKYCNKIGLLQLDTDRMLNGRMLRFYDLDNVDLLLEFQLYYGFTDQYKLQQQKGRPKINLFTFQVPSISSKALNQFRATQSSTLNNQKINSAKSSPLSQMSNLYDERIYERVIGFLFRNDIQADEMQKAIRQNCPKVPASKQPEDKHKETLSSALKYFGTEKAVQKQIKNPATSSSIQITKQDLDKGMQRMKYSQYLEQLCRSSWKISKEYLEDPQTNQIIWYKVLKNQAKKTNDPQVIKKMQYYERKQKQVIDQNKKKKIALPEKKQNAQNSAPNHNKQSKNGRQQKLVNINQISPTKMRRKPLLTAGSVSNRERIQQDRENENIKNTNEESKDQKQEHSQQMKQAQNDQQNRQCIINEIPQFKQSNESKIDETNEEEPSNVLDELMNLTNDFFKQIHDNKIKITNGLQQNGQIQLQINDQGLKLQEFCFNLKQTLNLRKLALNRRQASDQENEQNDS